MRLFWAYPISSSFLKAQSYFTPLEWAEKKETRPADHKEKIFKEPSSQKKKKCRKELPLLLPQAALRSETLDCSNPQLRVPIHWDMF